MIPMEVRPLTADEWEVFRDLRLRALADAPDAFRSTIAEGRAIADAEWEAMHRRTAEHPDGVTWVAEIEGVPVGQAFSRVEHSTVGIFGMWVAPEGRGKGAGRALLGAAEAWGSSRGCTTASLSVTAGNSPAERLYRSAGYRPTGTSEPLREGSDLACVEMTKPLSTEN